MKHRGRVVQFTWGQAHSRSIHWAAFYGDCQHEVLEVTSGHRITLTYNLYYSSIGPLARPVADHRQLPLYSIVGDTLQEAHFMPKGNCSQEANTVVSADQGDRWNPGLFLSPSVRTFSKFGSKVDSRCIQRGRLSRV